MKLVYVHGNGNKIREDLLKAQWDQALFGRDVEEASRMAYWAPVLHPTPLPDPEFDEIEQTQEAAPGFGETLAATVLEELGPGASAPDGLGAYTRAMAYTAEAVVAGDQRLAEAEEASEVLPLPRAARIAVFKRLVRLTFHDVHAYFFGGHADAMRAVVREAIERIDEPFAIVAHSLGSIIAYDVLREEAQRSLDVPLLVTVGSPLGVREIQDLITAPLEVPAGVKAWLNASDLRDVAALDHALRPEYDPPARCTDITVINASANHHGIREYLAAGAVRDAIHAALTDGTRPEVEPEASPAVEEQLNSDHRDLLKRLVPTLRYDSRERYFADSVATFVENRFEAGPMSRYHTRLRRANGGEIASADGALNLEFLRAGTYPNDQPVKEDDRLDAGPEPVADARRRHAEEGGASVAYGRVAARRGGGVWLQYWLFYFHSAKGIPGIQAADGLLGAGLHQGDWELIQVGIPEDQLGASDPQPDVAILAAHDYAHQIAWEDVDRDEQAAWSVYVGRASHASFPKAGRWKARRRGPVSFDVLDDIADGAGEPTLPTLEVIRLGEPAWVGWPGRWGSTKSKPLVGGGSPRGPWHQRPWSDPDGFASDAIPWTRHHKSEAEFAAEAMPVAQIQPGVSVGRDGPDWTITIAMPPGTHDSWAGMLTLASHGEDASGRLLWLYDVSRAGPAPSVGAGGA